MRHLLRAVRQHNGAWAEMIKLRVGDLPVMRLPGGQVELVREPLCVDDDMGLSREHPKTKQGTDIHISFRRSAYLWERAKVLSIISISTVIPSRDGVHQPVPNAYYAPRTNWLQQVVRGPWRSGRSRYRALDRSSQKCRLARNHRLHAWRFVGQQQFDHALFEVGQVVPAHAHAELWPGLSAKRVSYR